MYEQEVGRPDSSTRDKGERMQNRLPASQKILTDRTVGAPVGMYKANRRGDIFYADRGLADIFEYESPEEMVTESFLARCKNPGDIIRVIETLRKSGKIENLEIESLTKSGKSKNVLLSASLEGGVISGMIKDITGVKQHERQLIQAQKLESLGTLAGGIAHDFNNILGIILGHSANLERVHSDPTKFNQSVEAITKAAVRGASLVKQLLTFARQTEAVFETVRINDIITEIKKLMEETFDKTITISTFLQSDLPFALADATQIHLALLNLCINARDAMPKGGNLSISTGIITGESLKSRFPNAAPERYIRIDVADTGIGMDEATRHRIFEPFFTTKGPGKGTGLGLALVFSIVQNHHGFVGVESKLGIGTTFTVYLPVQEHAFESSQPSGKTARDVPGGTETILLIEDEETLRELVRAVLVSKGYTVITAEDGEEGLKAFLSHQEEIAVVICDVGLPRLGGVEVLQRIRARIPRTKVIIASGFIDQDAKAAMYKAGANEFIQKPYSPDEVLRKIRDIVDAGD